MKTALLVIDDDTLRADELCLLLRFMEETHVAKATSINWREQAEYNPGLRAIFLGRYGADEQLIEKAIQAIHAAAPDAAIILIEDVDQPRHLPTALDVLCSARLSHPFRYPRLSLVLAKLMQQRQRANRDARTLPTQRHTELFRSLIGQSPAIGQVRELIQRVAPSEATVLILGESGTGKEVVARNIHYFSARSQGPFVPINCGAIPDNLLESELFGHEKGAFTGAISARRGRFELAQGGTLFLDEIGDMPLNMQVKLLRVLQEHTFERVGSDRSLTANVRIIAATHRNLDELIRAGQFREDLYYRLNVFPIETPALRDRIEDLPLLAEDLSARVTHERGTRVILGPAVLRCLSHYPWLGNVRELANLIERLAILQPSGQVELDDLPPKFRAYYPADLEAADAAADVAPTAATSATQASNEAVSLPPEGLDLRQYIIDLESSLGRVHKIANEA